MTPQAQRFARFAWSVLAYNVAVILWGAVVRATGSGAGCGSHWPLCDGAVVPRSPGFATMIEFSHRLTSGLALLAVVALAVWAWRLYPRGSTVRRAAAASLVLVLLEAAIGAGLVLFELVAANASWMRALYLALHLCNTFFLLGALALTAFTAGRRHVGDDGHGRQVARLGAVALLLLILTGASGAVAALGDTLAPSTSHDQAVRQDLSATTTALLRVRIVHPLLALGAAAALLRLGRALPRRFPDREVRRRASALSLLVLAQIAAGVVNLMLFAPLAMQLVHLLLADLVWIAAVLALAATRWVLAESAL